MKATSEKPSATTVPPATRTTSPPFFAKAGETGFFGMVAISALKARQQPETVRQREGENPLTTRLGEPFAPEKTVDRPRIPDQLPGNLAPNTGVNNGQLTNPVPPAGSQDAPIGSTAQTQQAPDSLPGPVAVQTLAAPGAVKAGGALTPIAEPLGNQPAVAGDQPQEIQAPGNTSPPVAQTGGLTKNAGTGSAPAEQIATAPQSPTQAEALRQTQLINNDTIASELQISRIALTRKQQLTSQFAETRQGLTGFFTNSINSVQAIIYTKQAELMSAVSGSLTWVRTTLTGALRTAQATGIQIRTQISHMLEGLTASVQNRVGGIARQIIGVIQTVPLPNIPGIAQIRSTAVSLLNQAVGIVNGALGQFLGFVRSAFNAGMALLDSLMSGLTYLIDTAVVLVTSAILSVVQMIFRALSRAGTFISSILRQALQGLIVPLLNRLHDLLFRLIDNVEQRTRNLLRTNRNHYLASLAEAVTPTAAPPSTPPSRAPSTESRIAALQQLGQDAIQNNRLITSTLDTLISGTILSLVRLLAFTALRIMTSITPLLTQLIQTILTAVTQVIQLLGQLAQAIGTFVQELVQGLMATLTRLVDELRSFVQPGVDQLIQFAQNALNRIVNFIRRLIGNMLFSGGGITDAVGIFRLTRSYVPSYRGPSPSLPRLVVVIILALAIAFVELLGGQMIIVGATVFIIIAGIPITTTVTVVVIVAVVVVLLLLLLLYLLIRWLLKPKLPPSPPKRVIRVDPSVLELGVGGRDINSTATLAPGTPPIPPLTWTINPGGAAPAGISVIGGGPLVAVHAGQPPHGTIVGGIPITVRAALTANPADFADSAPVMMVQVVSATYAATPPLVPVPSLVPGTPPPNSAEPNRDGISGNKATVNAVTAPTGRPIGIAFRRSLGATVAGSLITPGSTTGDMGLRITDTTTDARLDETQPATAGPAVLMADMTVNAVPIDVRQLTFVGRDPAGPYSARNSITFAESDTLHPLTRIVGELITGVADDFNVAPPNGGFNPAFRLNLAVPGNRWVDRLVAPAGVPNQADNRIAIDVNRFVGPGVAQLPRSLIYRQQFQYSSWQGGGSIVSNTLADGQHVKVLFGTPPNSFQFRTDHRFNSGASSTPVPENYSGPPLIVFSNIVGTPTAPGASALAADGVATASLSVTSSVAGRTVRWSVLNGDIAITAGNPAVLPATATLKAGVTTGNFSVRVADTIFPNRQVDGQVNVAAVAFRNMVTTPNPVPAGITTATVSLEAEPGGRTVNWSIDASSAAAGVTIAPATTGPGAPPMAAIVTRPAGFTGTTVVTATDSVVPINRLQAIFFN